MKKSLLIALGFIDNGSNVFLMNVDGFHYDVDLGTQILYKIREHDYETIYTANFIDLTTFVRALGTALGKEI